MMFSRTCLPAAAGLARRSCLLAAVGAAVLAVPAGASAAAAAGAPAQVLFHTCKVIGSHGDVQAVHCADLLEGSFGGQSPAFFAQNEVYCQNVYADAIVDCRSVRESVETASSAAPGVGASPNRGECGASIGHSDCGARRIVNTALPPEFALPGQGTCHAWAVTGDNSFDNGQLDTVTLPDGTAFTARDLATPHVAGACQG